MRLSIQLHLAGLSLSNTVSDDVRAVVVGAHESKYADKVRRLGRDSVIIRGMQPFNGIPKWLAAVDVIAIPQEDSPATWGQMPSKVFEAMEWETRDSERCERSTTRLRGLWPDH